MPHIQQRQLDRTIVSSYEEELNEPTDYRRQ